MKKVIIWVIILIITNSLIIVLYSIYPKPVNTLADFDIIYEDPWEDVETDTGDQVSEHKDIDIIELKSRKSKDNRYLIIELKVAGKIKASENIEYNIYIINDEDFEYEIRYSNGWCTGYSSYDTGDSSDFLNSDIRNSNTLAIKLPLEKFKDLIYFDISADSYKSLKKDSVYDSISAYWDYFIIITEPEGGSTVYKNCTIKGILNNNDKRVVKSVEIQIGSMFPKDWKLANTTDNWENWSYAWNTESVPYGECNIYARAFDGYRYFYNKNTIYVREDVVKYPKTAGTPIYHVGDYYYYEGYYPEKVYWKIMAPCEWFYYIFEEVENGKITGIYNITLNGINYEVYTQEFDFEDEYWDEDFDSIIKYNYKATNWIRKSDLAPIKGKFEISAIDKHGIYIHHFLKEINYEYPNGYNIYPIIVGNMWNNTVIKSYTLYNFTSENETEIMNFTLEYKIKYHCLRTETLTVDIGTFEVFVIANQINYTKTEWYENDKINQTERWYDTNHTTKNIEYYSPKIGNTIKFGDEYNEYDPNSFELVAYKYGNEHRDVRFDKSLIEQSEIHILIISLVLINSVLVSTMIITSTEVGKYSFFKAIVPFFTKHKKKRNYEHGYIKGSVRGVIYGNPGENYSSIKKILGLPSGTLTYYLKALEKDGVVRSERDGFLKRFYPAGEKGGTELLELTDIQKNICNIIKNNPGISQKDILTKLDISQQNLSYHIQLMSNARIIKVERKGRRNKYYIIQEGS